MKYGLSMLSGKVSALALLFSLLSLPAAAVKHNSDYGIDKSVAFELSPANSPLPMSNVNNLPTGITMKLNSVWCTNTMQGSLGPPPTCIDNLFDYLFEINIS